MDKFKAFFETIKSLPPWARVVVLVLICGLLIVFSLTSCGPVVRVSAKSTTDTVSISISQHVTDSTGVSVSVNPNINIH